jgi:hypothetical protein
MTRMANAFRLSRVYAEGWMAARSPRPTGGGPIANPYPAEPEHSRWVAGFNGALAGKPSNPEEVRRP